MCIVVNQLSYIHSDKEILFQNISLSVEQGQKIALIGNNGSGKSILLQLIAGNLSASSGGVIRSAVPYYVPQHFGQYEQLTVAQALRIDGKLQAFQAILAGDASVHHFDVLADDWNIEERAIAALSFWGLPGVALAREFSTLSGGEKTRIFLAGIMIYEPEVILLDEPTNHLDNQCRDKLYNFVGSSAAAILVVSHDRTLLNLLSSTYELSKNGITYYGGNYEFYKAQREQAIHSLYAKLDEKEKELRLARKIAREAFERRQKQDLRGEKSNIKKGVGKMAMDTFKDQAEKSTSKLQGVHSDKMQAITGSITDIRTELPDLKLMKIDFNTSSLHSGKTLVTARQVNMTYGVAPFLWSEPLNFQIRSGERIVVRGKNGSGKTTLLRLITGVLEPSEGTLITTGFKYVYLDQEYSIIRNELSVFEQVQQFNTKLLEHEMKIILNRFLFPFETWDKSCGKLSGGEKMKLALCCLMVDANTPDVFILDEPTNNIDIRNVEILTATLKDYKGTVLVVSHDEYFIRQLAVDYSIDL